MKKINNKSDLIPVVHATLDGGPCGHKTTLINRIKKDGLGIPGLNILYVEEAARIYLDANKDKLSDLTVWQKQNGIFSLQLDLEEPVRQEADYMQKHGEKVLVLYDRSLKTNMAYMHHVVYHRLIEAFKMSQDQIDARYTDKLHLMSVAVDKPHLYVMDEERRETPEEAHAIDLRLQKIWHDTMIHDNSTTIDEKLDKAYLDVKSRVERLTVHF